MNSTTGSAKADRLQEQVAGVCLLMAAALMPVTTFFENRDGMLFWGGLVGVVSYLLFVPGLLGIAQWLRERMPRLTVFGGMLVVIGSVGGTCFSTAVLFDWAEREAGTPAATLDAIAAVVEGRVFPVLVSFGLVLPIALVVLAIGLFRTGTAPKWAAVLLGVGAVAFPIGHISQNEVVTQVANLLLIGPLVWSGYRMLTATRAAASIGVDALPA
jgi:hypothetical protein